MENTKQLSSSWKDELKKISACPQRQDSLNDQLRDLVIVSNKFGFYDASDFIENMLKTVKKYYVPKQG